MVSFSFRPLRTRVLASLLLMYLLVVGSSLYNISTTYRVQNELMDVNRNDIVRIYSLQYIESLVLNLQRRSLEVASGLPPGPSTLDPQEFLSAVNNAIMTYRAHLKANELSGHSADIITNIGAQAQKLSVDMAQLLDYAKNNPKAKNYQDRLNSIESQTDEIERAISVVTQSERLSLSEEEATSGKNVTLLTIITAAVLLVTLIGGLVVGIVLSRSIYRRMKLLRQGAQEVAVGNLDKKIDLGVGGGELRDLAAAFNDMTFQLKSAYGQVNAKRIFDETILQTMNDCVVTVNASGKIIFANQAAIRLFDAGVLAIEGRQITDVLSLFDESTGRIIPATKRPEQIVLKAKQAFEGAYIGKTGEKQKMFLSISARTVPLKGKTHAAVLVIRDITKDHDRDRVENEFISSIAHQIRTPLTAISWSIGTLMHRKLDAPSKRMAQNIAGASESMIQLVTSLLNVSRMTSERVMITPVPTDLKALVKDVVDTLKPQIATKRLKVLVNVEPGLPKINLDPQLTRQIYLNLLMNAVAYTLKGGEITVLVTREGREVVSQISDNGVGIPSHQQDRVFQKFFRADNVAGREPWGSGLGLSLVKSIVTSSGGRIWFESVADSGTTFWFSLPFKGMQPKEGEVTLEEYIAK